MDSISLIFSLWKELRRQKPRSLTLCAVIHLFSVTVCQALFLALRINE